MNDVKTELLYGEHGCHWRPLVCDGLTGAPLRSWAALAWVRRSIRKHKLTDDEQGVVNAYERRGIIGAVVVGTGVAGLTTWACTVRLAALRARDPVADGAQRGLA